MLRCRATMLPPRDADIAVLRLRLWINGEGMGSQPPWVAVVIGNYDGVSASVLLDLSELRAWHRQVQDPPIATLASTCSRYG
jgi:hypothetical protein